MTAFENYLIELSAKGKELVPDMPRAEVLQHLLEGALSEGSINVLELIEEACGSVVFTQDSMRKTADYLLLKHKTHEQTNQQTK